VKSNLNFREKGKVVEQICFYNFNDERFTIRISLIIKELSRMIRKKSTQKFNDKMSSKSDSELATKIKIDKYFRFCNFQTGFGVYSFSRLNDFSGGGFFNRKTFCDRS